MTDAGVAAVTVYRELLVNENTRKVELRYFDEATGRELTDLAKSLQALPAAQPDLALFICGGILPEHGLLRPAWAVQPPVVT
ncbi:MAG: hypothetical protein ACYC5O_15935 [Anaerolineae bacterium]